MHAIVGKDEKRAHNLHREAREISWLQVAVQNEPLEPHPPCTSAPTTCCWESSGQQVP